MYTRALPGFGQATTIFVGSSAGGVQIAASNSARAELRIQPQTDHFRIGPIGSMSATAGFFIGATTIFTVPNHLGPLFALPAGGATAAITVWESGF